MKNILVTGGAGYIGSHTCHMLVEQGFNVIVFDDLEKGHRQALPSQVKLYVGNLRNYDEINKAFQENEIDAVVHFAAHIEAGESMKNPAKYFENNISNGLNLLRAMVENRIENIVFSSSAAVYGDLQEFPITEDAVKVPTNYYGWTKLRFEEILDAHEVYGIRNVCLRYFNAAGAGENMGQDYQPVSALIPILMETALGKRKEFGILGTDYNTADGTAIRDFVHVLDLAKAHILALNYLRKGESLKVNVGNGKGYSVQEIVDIAREITGTDIKVVESPRREGDIEKSLASVERIEKEFGWKPQLGIKEIIESAWKWHSSHPEGYND